MKGQIKNRKTVATVMTKTRCGFGKNPDAPFKKKIGSRMLYHNHEKLTINAESRKHPNAQFSRVDLGEGAFIWAPTNKAGEEYLKSLPDAERNEFLYHSPDKSSGPKPESRRVVDGRPIKGLPNGHREADYFPKEFSAPPAARRRSEDAPVREMTEEEIAKIRADITAGTFV